MVDLNLIAERQCDFEHYMCIGMQTGGRLSKVCWAKSFGGEKDDTVGECSRAGGNKSFCSFRLGEK